MEPSTIVRWYPVTYEWEAQLEPDDDAERENLSERLALEQRQDSLYNAEIKGIK